MKGLYIHIPFCATICPYCDFSVWKAHERQHRRWFDLIQLELKQRCYPKMTFDTLYFGGGTPSLLSASLFSELMEWLHSYLDFSSLVEVSIEANPNCIDLEKIAVYEQYGVQRISLGVQSFQPDLLKVLGRTHQKKDIEQSLEMIGKSGLKMSLDLMFGLPSQNLQQVKKDIQIALQYPLSHLSFYGLIIEPQTLFYQQREKMILPRIAEQDYDKMYCQAVQQLEDFGLKRYEVSNFALKNCESIHNQNYWNHSEFLGIGSGAFSFLENYRIGNPKKFANYEKWVQEGCIAKNNDVYEYIDSQKLNQEKIWLGLRQNKGLECEKMFCKTKFEEFSQKIKPWLEKGYLFWDGSFLKLKDSGWLYLDEIVVSLWE